MFATFILVLFYRYDRVPTSLWIRYPKYSWVKATIGICTPADYSVAKKCQQGCLIVGWDPIFREVWVNRLVEFSTLMTKAPNSIGSNPCSHYTTAPLVTNPCAHKLASPGRLCPFKRIKNTSKNRKEQSWIADEWLSHESWGLTNWMSAKLFLTD
jgi:hypothetical protein